MQPNLTVRRPAIATLIALGASVAIAACGSSGPSGSGDASTGDGASNHDAGVKFAACVRTHGVPDFPDPSASGRGTTRASPSKMTVDGHTLSEPTRVVQRAMNQCRKYSPMAQGPPVSAAQLAKVRAAALAMAKCMRAHGVPDFPDPQVGTGPGGHGISIGIRARGPRSGKSGGIGGLDQSPAFKAAQKTCQPLMTRALPRLRRKQG